MRNIIFSHPERWLTSSLGSQRIQRRWQSSQEPGGSLSMQHKLARLPLPSLQDTMPKYLRSVKPLLTVIEYEDTFSKVKDFCAADGVGHRLQELLSQRAATKENWFSDWWLEMAYLGYRDPVVVWSSPGIVWPTQNFGSKEDQIMFAARAVTGALDYKISVDNENIPVEMQGGKPLDMQQYFKIFGTNRAPATPSDTQSFNPNSRHIVVIYKNQFFSMDVYGSEGELLSAEQILSGLQQVVAKAEDENGPMVGILTSNHRDIWASDYQALSQDNEATLATIETSLLTLSLDPPASDIPAPNQASRAAKLSLHGGGSSIAAANRWNDKTIQIFVSETGECGITYEHSPAEGPPLMVLTDHILGYVDGKVMLGNNLRAIDYKPPNKLNWKLSDTVKTSIANAASSLDTLANNIDMNILTFEDFGKGFMKNAGFSPDSFIQTAIQMTFHRIHGEPGAHYESGATRSFLHGRTDVIRTCSLESAVFAKDMLNPIVSTEAKYTAMQKAIKAHNAYAKETVAGFGVDRHLQGLKMIGMENDIPVPELFLDAGYSKSTRFRVSTSQVAGKSGSFLCFGLLAEDGYGCCYNPRENDMFLASSALNSSDVTSATDFRDALETTLREMRNLCLKQEKLGGA